jgi:stage II sporulation protein D
MLLAALIVIAAGPLADRLSYAAAVPKLDTIRIALYIPARGTVPAVTVSSASPMTLSYRSPAGTEPWISSSGTFRASLDQYAVIAARTAQYNAANQLQTQLSERGYHAVIYEETKGAAVEFVVSVGPYTTRGEAEQVRNTLAKAGVTGAAASAMELAGPYYWNAGSYPDAAAAANAAGSLNSKGLRAFSVIHKDEAGNTVHAVWIGGVADEAALNAVKSEAAKAVPGLALSPANTSLPYLVRRTDVTGGMSAPLAHYSLQTGRMKLWVTSESPLQVKERYGRSYRGSLEIGEYASGLAVVNELPTEEYLYSVVGSEMGAGWPLEALKAQAVAARTYALKQGLKYGIAHLSDTTYDQMYRGITAESPASIEAVQLTAGEVLVDDNGLIEALYGSNAGGMTADGSEVWGTTFPYLTSVPSPDYLAAEGLLTWEHVVLPDGTIGYIRSDFTRETGRHNEAGFALLEVVGTDVNVRPAPYVDNERNPAITQVNEGDVLVRIGRSPESNAYQWMNGPYTGEKLLASINRVAGTNISGPLASLVVTKRGPSGRVVELQANGRPVSVRTPDDYRSALMGIPSTRFEIDALSEFAILGAGGKQIVHRPADGTLYAVSGGSSAAKPVQAGGVFLAMSTVGEARMLSHEPLYRFVGMGYGHGLGMSQWGARELAEYMGYDYREILQYYYKGARLVKAE